MKKRSDIVRMIRALADGRSVDWDTVDSSVLDASMRAIVSELQVVSRIAEVHGAIGAPSAASVESPESLESDASDGDLQVWGPLTIMERVGSGTFGDVYRAWDGRLDREVALKLLRREAQTSEGRGTTVIEEGRLLARVRHPNVVTVYGADRIDGGVGIWMEFVEGRTLEQQLTETGPFPPGELAGIGVEVCRALTAVHRAGLLHGDVKARNVMREDSGRVVLMDFGAGRDVRQEDAGRLAGTALYLAPEVLDGACATEQSEIYSLGVLLYHLGTGSYPVQGRTLQEIRRTHRDGGSTPLREARNDLPESLVLPIDRALSRDPASRFESTGVMQAVLAAALLEQGTPDNRVVARGSHEPDFPVPSARSARPHSMRGLAVVGIVLAITAATMGVVPELRHRLARIHFGFTPRIESIAVLPFESQPGDDDRFLADGIADEIARQLGQIRHVRVLTRESSGRIQESDGREQARRLSVQTLLSGVFRKSPTGFEVHIRLVDGVSGGEVISIDYAGQLRDIGGPRGPAPYLARALQRRLWPGEAIAVASERSEPAYLAYLRGRLQLSPRNDRSLRAAVTRFEQAVAAEPTFAEAYAGLADAHTLMGVFGFAEGRDAWPKAKAAALEALRLDDRLAEAHTSLGFILELSDRRWADAEASYRRAIALNPSYALAHHWYALLLDSTLRPDEALREIDVAIALEPFSAPINSDRPMILTHHKRYDLAIEQFKKVIALHPMYAPAHNELGWTYAFTGHYDEGLASFERARQLGTDRVSVLTGIAWIHASAGRRSLAEDAMHEVERQFVGNPEFAARASAPFLLAFGDKDKALDVLVRTLPDGDTNILVSRQWDRVRDDRRYKEILRRTGLLEISGRTYMTPEDPAAASPRR